MAKNKNMLSKGKMSLGRQIAAGLIGSAAGPAKRIFGVLVEDATLETAVGLLRDALRQGRHTKIAFCNAHAANFAWERERFRYVLGRFTVFADGIGVDIAARILHGAPFAANLNGTDFVPALLTAETRPLRIALYGARPGVAAGAAAALARLAPQHRVVATMHGYAGAGEEQAFLARLEAAPVDVLLVALGNPRQEEWIARCITERHATLAIGVGALLDFLSGEAKRAPAWAQALRIEWLYRLSREPRRLARRYILGNPLFLARVLRTRFGGGPT